VLHLSATLLALRQCPGLLIWRQHLVQRVELRARGLDQRNSSREDYAELVFLQEDGRLGRQAALLDAEEQTDLVTGSRLRQQLRALENESERETSCSRWSRV
jgi:hypothetical protein